MLLAGRRSSYLFQQRACQLVSPSASQVPETQPRLEHHLQMLPTKTEASPPSAREQSPKR